MAAAAGAAAAAEQFKVNLTSLLDSLNVFSHSLVRDNPLEIEYSRGEALHLRCAVRLGAAARRGCTRRLYSSPEYSRSPL